MCAAAAAAKSPQSCLTLCDPIDGSPPGSPVPGILQARTLDFAAPLWVVALLLDNLISERGTQGRRGSWFGPLSAVLEECLLRAEFEHCENSGIIRTFSVL